MWKSASVTSALVAAPPLLLAMAVVLVVGVPPVRELFWPTPDANAAEAAVLDDMARIRLLADTGADLRAPLPVRPGLLDVAAPALMTPLEAAVRAGHSDAFNLVLELGATPTAGDAARLRCLAQQRGDTAIVERLSSMGSPGSAICE